MAQCEGGFPSGFLGRELSRCAQIFTNAQYSHALQLPILLILQEVAFNLEATVGAMQPVSHTAQPRSLQPATHALVRGQRRTSQWQLDRPLWNTQLPVFILSIKWLAHSVIMGKTGAVLKFLLFSNHFHKLLQVKVHTWSWEVPWRTTKLMAPRSYLDALLCESQVVSLDTFALEAF